MFSSKKKEPGKRVIAQMVKLDYGLDHDVMDSGPKASLPPNIIEENGSWILLLDVWLLLYARHCLQHLITSKLLVIAFLLALAIGVTGILLQRQNHLPLLGAISKYSEIATQSNMEDNADMKSELWKLYTEMKRLDEAYQNTINQLETKLQTLEHSSQILGKESSLEAQQEDKSHEESSLFKITETTIQKLIEDQIAKFEAERLGMADYALESSGGSIVATPDTENYKDQTWISVWVINLMRVERNNPRNIIQGPLQPGSCWAFYGSKGKVIIQLATIIHITSVTLEHISAKLSTTGNINSAPKDFAVFGLESDTATEVHLGSFTFDKNGPPRQIFHINRKEYGDAFKAVALAILSNHGHPEYTCVYRFRVHGDLCSEEQP